MGEITHRTQACRSAGAAGVDTRRRPRRLRGRAACSMRCAGSCAAPGCSGCTSSRRSWSRWSSAGAGGSRRARRPGGAGAGAGGPGPVDKSSEFHFGVKGVRWSRVTVGVRRWRRRRPEASSLTGNPGMGCASSFGQRPRAS